jgi:polysaccharide export outer membrane protein
MHRAIGSFRTPMQAWVLIMMISAGLLASLAGCAQGAGADQQAVAVPDSSARSPGYRLGPGDKVHITVFGEKDLTGDFQVDGTGQMSFPLIGQVAAGGLTADQLSQTLVSRLKPDYLRDPRVAVEVLTYRPFYVVGEVKTPGSYPFVSNMTVLNAVALAGGFTYRAREDSFYLTRNGQGGQKTRIDATPDTPVQPGDVITVR